MCVRYFLRPPPIINGRALSIFLPLHCPLPPPINNDGSLVKLCVKLFIVTISALAQHFSVKHLPHMVFSGLLALGHSMVGTIQKALRGRPLMIWRGGEEIKRKKFGGILKGACSRMRHSQLFFNSFYIEGNCPGKKSQTAPVQGKKSGISLYAQNDSIFHLYLPLPPTEDPLVQKQKFHKVTLLVSSILEKN